MEDDDIAQTPRPDSLLPYDEWAEEALRGVAIRALQFAARDGMPGEHHFYVSFRTDFPGVVIPTRLLAQYPEEMTIVLQHQFWDLKVDETARRFSIGLSFGGVGSVLTIPFAALTAFADPHVQFGLRFRAAGDAAAAPPAAGPTLVSPALVSPPLITDDTAAPEPLPEKPAEEPQVVSLDAFRKRKD